MNKKNTSVGKIIIGLTLGAVLIGGSIGGLAIKKVVDEKNNLQATVTTVTTQKEELAAANNILITQNGELINRVAELENQETTQTVVIFGLYLVTFEVNSEAGDAGTYVFGIEINDSQCVTKLREEGLYEVFNIEDIMQEDNSIYFEALNLKILPDYANKTYAFEEQNHADNLAQGINFTKIEKVNVKEFNSGIFAE